MATKLPKELYLSIYSQVPRFCVELLIKTSEGILLTLRDIEPKIGFWHLPGGTVLMDESVEDAVKRVANEELGTDVRVLGLEKYIDYYLTDSVKGHAVSLVFNVEVIGDIKLDHQASDFGYFSEAPDKLLPEYLSLFN
jgi:ADP-ribose pyrophosphatase YjhB (NUDIX family)